MIINTIRTKSDGTYNTEVCHQDSVRIIDHLMGFDQDYNCDFLSDLAIQTLHRRTIATEYIFDKAVIEKYNKFDFVFDINTWYQENNIKNIQCFETVEKKNFQNFICSFNHSPHVSRLLLTSALHHYEFFDPGTCSKHFTMFPNDILGYLYDFVGNKANWYSMFFNNNRATQIPEFYGSIFQFGRVSADHGRNQQILRNKIDHCFLHVVSETMATSYQPFVTEKFLYSVAQKGLFLAYAQPRWHRHVEHYFGFRRYNKIFNYDFDNVRNPVDRLLAMLDMISRFKKLTVKEWNNLYKIEQETIDFNFEHFKSGQYLTHLATRIRAPRTMTPFDQDLQLKIK
jgi:hypothetical protein